MKERGCEAWSSEGSEACRELWGAAGGRWESGISTSRGTSPSDPVPLSGACCRTHTNVMQFESHYRAPQRFMVASLPLVLLRGSKPRRYLSLLFLSKSITDTGAMGVSVTGVWHQHPNALLEWSHTSGWAGWAAEGWILETGHGKVTMTAPEHGTQIEEATFQVGIEIKQPVLIKTIRLFLHRGSGKWNGLIKPGSVSRCQGRGSDRRKHRQRQFDFHVH